MNHSDRIAESEEQSDNPESGRNGNREFLDLYRACDDLVGRILALPQGTHGVPSSDSTILTFWPKKMETMQTSEQIEFLQFKQNTLAKLLASLQQQAAAVVLNPRPSPLNTAAVAAVWPAQEHYRQVRSGTCPHPILPSELANARVFQPKDGRPARTLPAFYWQSCYEEILYCAQPLHCAALNCLFDERCVKVCGAKTEGHKSWLRVHSHLLLVLYKAAGVKVKITDFQAMKVLHTYWRKRGKEVLGHLAAWFEQSQNRTVHADAALLSAVRHIHAAIPEWPVQEDSTELHCFCNFIMSEERFREVSDIVRRGAVADLAANVHGVLVKWSDI